MAKNQKKWRKQTPLKIWFYIWMSVLIFSGGPPTTLSRNQKLTDWKNRACAISMSIVPNNIGYAGYYFVILFSGLRFQTKSRLWTYVRCHGISRFFFGRLPLVKCKFRIWVKFIFHLQALNHFTLDIWCSQHKVETVTKETKSTQEFFKENNRTADDASKFYYYYESQGWMKANGMSVKNWKMTCRSWWQKEEKPKFKLLNGNG